MEKLFIFIWITSFVWKPDPVSGTNPVESLKALPEIKLVEEQYDSVYGKYFRCLIRQPYDHDHPEEGTFNQQFTLFYRSDSLPVVLVTCGGSLDSLYWTEAADLLKANQVMLETRYCGRSKPQEEIHWNTLTMQQIASDIHAVISTLKKGLFTRSYWVSTGRGIGGEEALHHKRHYPGDVQQTILYNTPLCYNAPDKRVSRYQVKVGKPAKLFNSGGIRLGANGGGFSFFPSSSELNYDIKDFQQYCFNHQDSMQILLEKYGREKGASFLRVGSLQKALQLTILEYRPAFFYKTVSKELIPYEDYDNVEFYFEHLISVSDPLVFSDSCLKLQEPIAWLALNETGTYEYFIRPFRKLLDEKISDHTYLYAADMPIEDIAFQEKKSKEMQKWIQREAKDIIFIYGLLDIYSAARVNLKKNNSCTLLVDSNQGALCRIENFDWGTCNYLKDLIITAYREYLPPGEEEKSF